MSKLSPRSHPRESPEGKKFFLCGYFVQDVSDILQNISELQCTHVQWVYSVHPTPARTGGWCHCLEWTGEDMVQTSGGWTNHRPGMGAPSQWQPRVRRGRGALELRTVSTGPPCHSSSISQAQQDTAQPGSGDRHKVKQTSDPSDKWDRCEAKCQDDDITVLEPLQSMPRPRCRQGKLQMSISCRYVCRDVLLREVQTFMFCVWFYKEILFLLDRS